MADRPNIAVLPSDDDGWFRDTVAAAGAELTTLTDADALVWTDPNRPEDLGDLLRGDGAHLQWVQLPWAGVEPYADVMDQARHWTCAKVIYGAAVAEMALAMVLAGFRELHLAARATRWRDDAGENTTAGAQRNLRGARVTILGGGGIATEFIDLLEPFDTDITVVRRHPAEMRGVTRVLGDDRIDDALAGAEVLLVALALTAETTGILDRRRLELLAVDAWVINMARGAHIVTDDLVGVLRDGRIGGAALDVTDPEPLPDGHPLWSLPNCIITPHVANTGEMARRSLRKLLIDNIGRFRDGRPLLGTIDVAAGY